MKKIKLLAPAKINLFLEILGKRSDGYHNINTLFAKIEVFDKISIAALASAKGTRLEVINNCRCKLPPNKKNIITKAVSAFRKEFGFKKGLKIILEKNIPVGAGLGGGSSDAASTLIGLCSLSGHPLNPVTNKRLIKIAAKLGADVAFFLYKDTFCIGKGIGEKLFPLHVKKLPLHVVIAYPGFAVPTETAYKNLELPPQKQVLTKLGDLNKLKSALRQGLPLDKWKKFLFNRLESSVLPCNKRLGSLHGRLKKLSGSCALMSGSGSSIYAVTEDKKRAEVIAKAVQKKAKIVFNTCFLGEEA
jgi:4-diphosphocytidyl-2-C-methyl-D-erythritol kinase